MSYIPLELPPGVYRNGTEFQARGRWNDASLVRWANGEIKPVGGWQQKGSTTMSGLAHGIISWTGGSIGVWVAIGNTGTNGTKLYAVRADNTFFDITPTSITQQGSDASDAGYGWLDYGGNGTSILTGGTYGTPRTAVADAYNFASTWSLDTWGEYLVACLYGDGRIYEWDLDTATVAQPVANAPTECSGLVVTEERFLFALGADADKRKIRWCDQEDNTTWTPASTNQAGSFILESEGPIVQAVPTRGQTIILTTTDVFTATYIGAPLVYSFERVGSSNGIVSRKAAVASDSFVAWMGPRGFWAFDGFVRQIPCEVEDHVFSDFNYDQQSKVHGWVNSQHSEIWWHYPSASSSECNRYVAWNYLENHWSIGTMDSLAACDRGVLRYPLMVHSDGKLYEHEIVGVATGSYTPYLTSGPIALPDYNTGYLTKLIPDEKTQGDVYLTLLTKRFPNGTEQSYGPYHMRDPVSLRCNARQVRMKVTQASTGDWRFGVPHVQMRKGGER